MFRNKPAITQWLQVTAWEFGLTAAMVVVYIIIGKFTDKVIIGAVLGAIIASLNFLALTITVSKAADRAEGTGEAAKAKMSVQASSVIRMLVLAGIYILLLKAEICDPIAALLPLIFIQLGITLMEFFRKDGANKK